MKDLTVLNDVEENEKFVEKLLEWMKTKWARVVRNTMKEESRYPTFSEFTSFVVEEAEIQTAYSTKEYSILNAKNQQSINNTFRQQRTKKFTKRLIS